MGKMLAGLTLWLALVASANALECRAHDVLIHDHFETGHVSQCRVLPNGFELVIAPENTPINPSPWYAMILQSDKAQTLTLRLRYNGYKHRYWPQLSLDGVHWQRVPESQVRIAEDKKSADVTLKLQAGQQWLAAQPIVDNQSYQLWMQQLTTQLPSLQLAAYGKSAQGRLLYRMQTPAGPKPAILLLGRAHPPEVTGAIAMQAFVDEILGDSPLAQQFRQACRVLIYPNLNPDGVANGFWRHNSAGLDLNRDWGVFSQPETAQTWHDIQQQLEHSELWLMLDFHSTWRNTLYSQKSQQPSWWPDFATQWLQRWQDAPLVFAEEQGYAEQKPTAKTFFYNQFQIPSMTYELADNAEPAAIDATARQSAQRLMQMLLAKAAQ